LARHLMSAWATTDGESDRDGGGPPLLASVRRLRREETVAILVDGLIDASVGYDVFGRLRDELWALGHVWAVAVRPRDSGVCGLRQLTRLGFLSLISRPSTMKRPSTYIRPRVERGRAPHRRPRPPDQWRSPAIRHRAAEEMLKQPRGSEPQLPDSRQEAVRRASELGRSEAMAAAELAGLGRPTSAHDPDLLETTWLVTRHMPNGSSPD